MTDLATRIEHFVDSLRAETRLYPDLWAERLAVVLQGGTDPGPMRKNENGVLILIETGSPYVKTEKKSSQEPSTVTWRGFGKRPVINEPAPSPSDLYLWMD